MCAPGYYGDAITLKDCQPCICDETGTERCDSYTGTCQCLPNVIGEKCEGCQVEHYGFMSREGCVPCECQLASESTQCDDATGQCRCKHGVTGRTCDRCAPGFWDYGPDGCLSCGCNTEYSLGFGCNAMTGHCECLPGVIGEKCDHCPNRWVLIENQGCFACDSCTHDLLDYTDELKNITDPFIEEFENVASGYFTTRRLNYINNTLHDLQPGVDMLDPSQGDVLKPITQELETLEQDSKNLNRKSNYSLENSEKIIPETTKLIRDAEEVLDSIQKTVENSNNMVLEVDNLTFYNERSDSDRQPLEEAREIVNKIIKAYNFDEQEEEAIDQVTKASDLLEEMKEFNLPVIEQQNNLDHIKSLLEEVVNKIDDISNYTQYTFNNIAEAEELNMKYRGEIVIGKIDTIQSQADVAIKELQKAHESITNATSWLADAHRVSNKLRDDVVNLDDFNDEFNNTISKDFAEIDSLEDNTEAANRHAENLITEVRNDFIFFGKNAIYGTRR